MSGIFFLILSLHSLIFFISFMVASTWLISTSPEPGLILRAENSCPLVIWGFSHGDCRWLSTVLSLCFLSFLLSLTAQPGLEQGSCLRKQRIPWKRRSELSNLAMRPPTHKEDFGWKEGPGPGAQDSAAVKILGDHKAACPIPAGTLSSQGFGASRGNQHLGWDALQQHVALPTLKNPLVIQRPHFLKQEEWRQGEAFTENHLEPSHRECCVSRSLVLLWRCLSTCASVTLRSWLHPERNPSKEPAPAPQSHLQKKAQSLYFTF